MKAKQLNRKHIIQEAKHCLLEMLSHLAYAAA